METHNRLAIISLLENGEIDEAFEKAKASLVPTGSWYKKSKLRRLKTRYSLIKSDFHLGIVEYNVYSKEVNRIQVAFHDFLDELEISNQIDQRWFWVSLLLFSLLVISLSFSLLKGNNFVKNKKNDVISNYRLE